MMRMRREREIEIIVIGITCYSYKIEGEMNMVIQEKVTLIFFGRKSKINERATIYLGVIKTKVATGCKRNISTFNMKFILTSHLI